MFTGLVEEIGTVVNFIKAEVSTLKVKSIVISKDVALGDSVAVNGVCLTVTGIDTEIISFDAVIETISRTALESLKNGDRVNLEAALRVGKMLGGHFVLGHVDGVGVIESIKTIAASKVIRIKASPEVMRYVVEKGSIAVDGISLTIAACKADGFEIAIIPHTLGATTLENRVVGDEVNLETDIIGKYVEKFVSADKKTSSVTEDLLRRTGFM